MVYSVVNQHYDNWELVLVNTSNNISVRSQAEKCANIDDRIKVVDLEKNQGISNNTNIAIKNSSGEFIAFLDHDDIIHPCALHSVVEALQTSKKPDLIYTDEDKITADSNRYFNPHLKPDWSPDLLNNVNYINHLLIVKTEFVRKVGGLRAAYDGAQDYDLLLRVIDQCAPRIKHISRVLYSWRAAQQSTAKDIDTKQYVFYSGVKALSEHIKRNNISAKVKHLVGKPGFYELIYKPIDFSLVVGDVSLLRQEVCAKWLTELLALSNIDNRHIELVIGDWYEKFKNNLPSNLKIKYVASDQKDYWATASHLVSMPIAICFKIAALPKSKHGLDRLAAAAADINHIAVGPVIVSHKNTILDSGIVDLNRIPRNLFEGYEYGTNTYFGNTDWVRNVDDLSTNVVALSREKLLELVEFGVQTYHRANTILSILPSSSVSKTKFVTWAHSPFEYKGLLKPSSRNSYYNSQLFKFVPIITMHVDNWGDDYAKESDV
jgi:glycosyltransferase involved in cell wall biosynthesis